MIARRLVLTGHVQGVGFRPFVYRLAHRHGLAGSVQNQLGQVEIRVQGGTAAVAAFTRDVVAQAPPLAEPHVVRDEPASVDAALAAFRIAPSAAAEEAQVFVPPDFFACDDCLRELDDPADRRHRYPFVNCTQCGPRYTLITRLPYDRPNTSMAGFPLCEACGREYREPLDRRFHAEPIACPACGPAVELRDRDGRTLARREEALRGAVLRLRAGGIVAVKGIGGYHLLCDARREDAVAALRERKRRPGKPLAVLFPRGGADGLDVLREYATPDAIEAAQLRHPSRPIVLVAMRRDAALAPAVAPGLREVGAFLPYSPLHQLLLADFGGPLVATSGNLSGEPVLTDADAAQARLAHVADAFLHHDRPIVRPADDSVCRVIAGEVRPMRLGRGVAPLELELPWPVRVPTLATGAHLKNCVALAWGRRIVVSPHIGTLGSPRSLDVFRRVIEDLQALYGVRAERVVCDAHPGYASSRWARESGLPVVPVWHHEAHASAVAGEYAMEAGGHAVGAGEQAAGAGERAVDAGGQPAGAGEDTRWLVFAWDGVGLGADGALWGGEAFLGAPGAWRRVASLRTFRLPGGDRVAREPWRAAASLCWHAGLEPPRDVTAGAAAGELALLHTAWERGLNAPYSSAAGRLFDGAAALVTGIRATSYEAEAPMRLETLAAAAPRDRERPAPLPLSPGDDGVLRADWAPLVQRLAAWGDAERVAAAAFVHDTLVETAVAIAHAVRAREGDVRVGLGGGVFQNRVLAEGLVRRLGEAGFAASLGRRLPCNDAGLAYGQIVETAGRER